jgi:hypothetical protein
MVTVLVLSLIGAFFYGQIGYQTARKSLDVWDKEDNDSPAAFLLFPTCFRRGTVGSAGESAISAVFSSDSLKRSVAEEGRVAYIAVMLFLWPFRLCWNVPAIVLQGAAPVIRYLGNDKSSLMGELRSGSKAPVPLPPAPTPEAPALPPASPVEDLRNLLDQRKALDDKIASQQAEIRGALEAEQTIDPDFPDCEPKPGKDRVP